MLIDGVQVTDGDDDMPLLQSGTELFLILVYDKDEGKYRPSK